MAQDTERERGRGGDRRADRQRDGQRGGRTEGQADRQAETEKEKESDGASGREREGQEVSANLFRSSFSRSSSLKEFVIYTFISCSLCLIGVVSP